MAEGGAPCASSVAAVQEPCPAKNAEIQNTTVRLKLRHPKSKKKVVWTNETVDNEHMNRKKSKCCCIYEKPHAFGESSSDTDDECDHCRGHVDAADKNHTPPDAEPPNTLVEPDDASTR